MVISPKGLAGNLGDRRATKLASPDDERVVEQPALLEVGQKRCGGSISSGALASMLPLDVRVRIPSSVIELNEPDAVFDESSCHQTIVGEGGFSWFRAVQSKGRWRLVSKVGQRGNAGLHAEGHLVRCDARQNLRIAQRVMLALVHPTE